MTAPNEFTSRETPPAFGELRKYVQACSRRFAACIDLEGGIEPIAGFTAKARIHFIRGDKSTGEPQVETLTRALSKHIVSYCLSASTIKSVEEKETGDETTPSDATRKLIDAEILLIARDYFRKVDTAGELGELLLFFFLETVFQAPQVVAKMELKTSPGDEVKRSDGIHFGWDEKKAECIVYFGESKLYSDGTAAVRDSVASIEKLVGKKEHDDELRLFTSHFKHLDPAFQSAVITWTNREQGTDKYRIVHTCLVGYDWDHYKSFTKNPSAFLAKFKEEIAKEGPRVRDLIKTRLESSAIKHLEFEFIIFPFPSVHEFRESFYRHLSGMDKTEQALRAELATTNTKLAKALKELRALKKGSKTP